MLSIVNESDLNIKNDLYVIKFWATWCQPCKMMVPSLNKLEKEFPDIKFVSVDIDQVPMLAKRFKIRTVPTLLVFKDGDEINRVLGMSLITPLRKIFREITQDNIDSDIKIKAS